MFCFSILLHCVVRIWCDMCVLCVQHEFYNLYIMYFHHLYKRIMIYLMLGGWVSYFFYYFPACMHVTYIFRNTVVIIINFWWAFFYVSYTLKVRENRQTWTKCLMEHKCIWVIKWKFKKKILQFHIVWELLLETLR